MRIAAWGAQFSRAIFLAGRRLAVVAILIVLPCTATIAVAQIAQGPAKRDVERYLGRDKMRDVVGSPVFYGDFTGDGRNDAIAFVYAGFRGGNGVMLDVMLFEGRETGFKFLKMAPDIFGVNPRDVRIRPSRIDVTMTTQGPNDARCCPSLTKVYSIEISGMGSGPTPRGAPTANGRRDEDILSQRWCNDSGHIQFRNGMLTIEASGNAYRIRRVVLDGCQGLSCTYRQLQSRGTWIATRRGGSLVVRGPLHNQGDGNTSDLENGVETYSTCN